MINQMISIILIFLCCIIGIAYAIFNAFKLSSIKIGGSALNGQNSINSDSLSEQNILILKQIASQIEKGSQEFLFGQYKYIFIFLVLFAISIFFLAEEKLGNIWVTAAFLIGAFTSMILSYVSLRAGLFANFRTVVETSISMPRGFTAAYQAGQVVGFSLTSINLLILIVLILVYTTFYMHQDYSDFYKMYSFIAGYSFGGSTVDLFTRVGSGIFAKAADIGADIVGKIESSIPEDSYNNPASIIDNIGDNVGGIAAMSTDMVSSLSESICIVLIIASSSPTFFYQPSTLYYPLLISAFGIIVSVITTFFANIYNNNDLHSITRTLFFQIFLSTLLATPASWIAGYLSLPNSILFDDISERKPIHVWFCCLSGLWSGLLIQFLTLYFTSYQYNPVKEVVNATKIGISTNVISSMALGHLSTALPIIFLAIATSICYYFLGILGIAFGSLGMISTIAIGLAIETFGSVSDNASGIAEMSQLNSTTRERADILNTGGNTTDAIVKGLVIASSALISLSVYGAFIYKVSNPANYNQIGSLIQISDPQLFIGLLIGAMIPYLFSAFILKSVSQSAELIVKDARRQIREQLDIVIGMNSPHRYQTAAIATSSPFTQMLTTSLIVIAPILIAGILFGPILVAGMILGILVSSVSLGISHINMGTSLAKANKYIEFGHLKNENSSIFRKGSIVHNNSQNGENIGDPLKDSSGPALNILIKFASILAFIFAAFFDSTAFFLKKKVEIV